MTHPLFQGVTPPLAALGVIRAEGPDAAAFLHGQLTQDFLLLKDDAARLAALCSPKGRMLASFVAWRQAPDQFLLVCSRDLLAATLKRLSMFVLRAKAKLSDATADFDVRGLAGAAIAAAGADPGAAPGQRHAVAEGVSVVALHACEGVPRALWLAPAGTAAPAGTELGAETWAWSEVMSGVVSIGAPVADAFVPQMLNYESVGGVNFKKGCYPGQEVVARSQFRGTLKRRGYVVSADGPLAAGAEVFGADPEQPVGTVAAAAPAPGGGWAGFVSIQVSALEAGGLRAGHAALTVQPLPYPLLEDI
ncbi:folate-binding protein YgfZ [Pseudacidovorax sp. RU35E]|uniref:CAF17-like 4Fe-4S cluster assembly/insertion protein YgfZ n=1 Tax=Pseudacidovorax sp. RU35E TaxID=1907403 RepID=UPI000955BEEE|nr:folate-binding protein YgfZ [Pseudacidovorax sp. RU35E]SIR27749.1 hypothetical protein SAMN05880557_109106 [Pseudacidovorax sp. RU35E]